MKLPPSASLAAGLAGLTLGLALATTWLPSEVPDTPPPVVAAAEERAPEPVRPVPRTRLEAAVEEARTSLARNRPWAAWTALRDHVEDADEADPATVLLSARAAAGWGGWSHVRTLLRGEAWLDAGEREGWYLLARAEEEGENWERAAEAYRRYLALPGARSRGVAQARLGQVLLSAGREKEAAQAFGAAAVEFPAARDWLRTLQAEALAAAGDPEVVVVAAATSGVSGPMRARQARAEADFWLGAGDTTRAVDRLAREEQALMLLGEPGEAAPLQLERARLLRALGRGAEARDLLRTVAADSAADRDLRLRAARLMEEGAEQRTAEEELARAAAFEAGGKPGLAARALRAALAAGAPDTPELRLRRARLLFEERDFGPARAAFLEAAERQRDPERAAEAELYAARARIRGGDRAEGVAALRRLVEARPGTAAAGAALFHLGDLSGTLEQGVAYYRRAAAAERAPEAREALYRLGDRSLKLGDTAAALRAWEEYVRRYPRGEETARAAYRAGVLHEKAGREKAARAMYTAAIHADPVSYHALRAGERMGVDPLDRTLRANRPWIGLASDARDAAQALARLDALEAAGLDAEWSAELKSAIRRLEGRPAALLALAEGVRDRGHAVEGIRLGRRLLKMRGGEWDPRLMRVVFPYPYRDLLEEAARDAKVDPALLAGLVRQESGFDPEARSWVGATGLAQVMPSTGRWIAPRVGIHDFRTQHLTVPEVSLEMGALYLRDQLRRYDGARDLALAAYNAGPGRADRWRRELGHGGDVDAFRERIPFDETRHYVQVVLRNAALYRRLYGERRSPGLVSAE